MKKRIKLSKDARKLVSHLAAKSLEDESFQKKIDTLLAKSDDEIKEGLVHYIKKDFPDLVDKNIEEEVLTALRQDKTGDGVIDLQRRSRVRSGAEGTMGELSTGAPGPNGCT